MKKLDYINKIICEHWFDLISWKGQKWDDMRKSYWLSGMVAAWNLLKPHETINDNEVMLKISMWNKEQAQQWYDDYLVKVEQDNGRVESRWQILDLNMGEQK